MAQINEDNTEKKLTSTQLGTRTPKEVWIGWFTAIGKWIWKKVHSPTGVWMFSVWLTSIIIMLITGAAANNPDYGFFQGPKYWIDIFLTYGLNTGQDPSARLVAKPFLNWFFAPMVVLVLGVLLFFLPASGFFRNGAMSREEADFESSFMFFNEPNIWGINAANPNANNPKMVPTYLWIVWMPIILGTAIAGIYMLVVFKKIQKRDHVLPRAKNLLVLLLIAGFIAGFAMALMTGNVILSFSGILRSLFIERNNNNFFQFGLQYGQEGQYHPIGIALTAFLVNFIPFLLVYAILLFIVNLDTLWRNKAVPYERIKYRLQSRALPELELREEE